MESNYKGASAEMLKRHDAKVITNFVDRLLKNQVIDKSVIKRVAEQMGCRNV